MTFAAYRGPWPCPTCGQQSHDAFDIGTAIAVSGLIAYEGYREQCGGKSLISGAELPHYEKQSPEIQAAWDAAAQAVVRAITDAIRCEAQKPPGREGAQ